MVNCQHCKVNKADYIVLNLPTKKWVFNCVKCIDPKTDLVVPQHMIDQLMN
jgi:hypothetical protein